VFGYTQGYGQGLQMMQEEVKVSENLLLTCMRPHTPSANAASTPIGGGSLPRLAIQPINRPAHA
jgi:hypothetical protein